MKKEIKKNFLYFFKNYKNNSENFIKIMDRNLFIMKYMVGLKVAVHNGKYFIPFIITKHMVGHLIGSFAFAKQINLKKIVKNRN